MKKSVIAGIVLFVLAASITLFYSCTKRTAKAQKLTAAPVTAKPSYKLLYYVINDDGSDELCTADYDGTNVHRIHIKRLSKKDILEDPLHSFLAISPDHKTIFFSVIRPGKKEFFNQTYACNINGSNLHPIHGRFSRLLAYAPVNETKPYKLLYIDYDQKYLYTADSNGANPQRIPVSLPEKVPMYDYFLAVSPDHKTIFFSTGGMENGKYFSQPYACNSDGSHLHPVLGDSVMKLLPYAPATETPSYKLLYYYRDGLYTANADGTNPQPLHIKGLAGWIDDDYLAISPDYKTVFFAVDDLESGPRRYQTYACDIDGSNAHPILGSGEVMRLVVY